MKHFTFNEFEKSNTAIRMGICNTIPITLKSNIEALVNNVLDPIRDYIKMPVYVNSGYRCPLLNKAVGGVQGSQHVQGKAADITTHIRKANLEIVDYATNNLTFDQIIVYKDFVHISYNQSNNRKQVIYKGK